jgi:hypothetical protein|tara:strand:+ start:989 stop:1477 length:489 start_codon:yes stop_codon:yes gene_type:complete
MKEERKHQSDTKPSAKKTKAKGGRPVEKVDPAIIDEICAWIADGNTLRSFCRLNGKPAWRTVYGWLFKDEEFQARFAHARDIGQDAIAEDTLEIIDEFPLSTGGDNPRLDSVHVQYNKNRVEQRMKLLAKWNPKKYGDKVGVEHQGGVSISVITGVPQSDTE